MPCIYDDKEIVSTIFDDEFFRGMFSLYIEISREITNKRVLDFGCGYGWGTSYMSKNNRHVLGFDIRKERIHWAKNVYSFEQNVDFTHMWSDVTQHVFDVVALSHVLHELENPFVGAKEIVNTLGDNGRIYIGEKMRYKQIVDTFVQEVSHVWSVVKEEEKILPLTKEQKIILKTLTIKKNKSS